MRTSSKFLAASILTASMLGTSVFPAFAQTYSPAYNSGYTTTTPAYTTTSPGADYNLKNNYPQSVNTYGTQNFNYNTQSAYPQNNYSQPNVNYGYTPASNNYLPPLQGRVVTVPAGSAISARTTTQISSEYLSTGDTVSVVLGSDFYFNGMLVAPANSTVIGNVVVGEKAGLTGKNGKLKIRFTGLTTPNGQRIPISGKLYTEDGTGMLIGGTSKERTMNAVKNTAMGAGMGALAGTILGPISGGKVGKGAVMGTAIGGGLGLGKTIMDKGENVVIPANSSLDITLDQPLTVNPTQTYGY
jgi:hypothetical protein